jgi:FkbM family methyltransferase
MRCGVKLFRFRKRDLINLKRARFMKEQKIDVVLDAGANTGQYASELRCAGFAGRIVSFEPLPDAYGRLQKAIGSNPRWKSKQAALGAAPAQMTIHITENSYSSSLLKQKPELVAIEPPTRVVRDETVEVVTLDSQAELFEPQDRILLKMDVQGYELQVLAGATKTLEQVRLIETEMSLVPLYENQPKHMEMIAALDALGFDLISIEPGFHDKTNGRMLEIDGIFVKRPVPAK